MGDGKYGDEPGSAVITNMGFINPDGSHTQAKATPYITDPLAYNMGNFTTGDSFTYGGPGLFAGTPFCRP